MLQSFWTENGIALRNVEPPALQPGWARLRVAACGICGSDLHRYRHAGRGEGTPGHELVGTIMQASSALPDSLYAVEPWIACGHCDYCLGGERQNCRTGLLVGVQTAGGLSEFLDVPENLLYPMHASLSPRLASMAEPTGICVHAIQLAELKLDTRVLILGGGTLGLLSGMLARDLGGRVAVTTRYPQQAEVAKKLGIQSVPEAEALGFGAEFEPDVVLETVGGQANTLEQATQVCRSGGRIVVLGLFSGPLQFDARALVFKELKVMGSKIYGMSEHGPEFRAATQLVPRYKDELALLQTHEYPLSKIGEAFASAADKTTHAIKVTVLP